MTFPSKPMLTSNLSSSGHEASDSYFFTEHLERDYQRRKKRSLFCFGALVIFAAFGTSTPSGLLFLAATGVILVSHSILESPSSVSKGEDGQFFGFHPLAEYESRKDSQSVASKNDGQRNDNWHLIVALISGVVLVIVPGAMLVANDLDTGGLLWIVRIIIIATIVPILMMLYVNFVIRRSNRS